MLTPLKNFYLQREEPFRGCLMALRDLILRMYKKPYIGIVESKHIDHSALMIEKGVRMKIMLIDPEADLPVETINTILMQAIAKY